MASLAPGPRGNERRDRRVVLGNVALAVAYLAAARLSLLLKHPVGDITPLWLPAGIGVAGMLHFGRRVLPGIVTGHVLGSVMNGVPMAGALVAASAGLIELLIAHHALRRVGTTLSSLLEGLAPMLRFVVVAALPATLVGAVVGVTGLWAAGLVARDSIPLGIGMWFAGDLVGMLLVVPLLALGRGRVALDTRARALVPVLLALAATVVIFFLTDPSREGHQVYGYLIFPFMVWTALVARVPTVVLGHTLIAGLAITATALGQGPYAATGSVHDVWLLQAFVVALVATSLLLRAAMEDRRRGLKSLHFQAHHDVLTGLPNRRGMQSLLEGELNIARADATRVGVLFVDLDNFKNVNDTIGHAGGDRVLAAVAQRLQGAAQAAQTFTRPGGDEFVVVARSADSDAFTTLAQRTLEALREPIVEGPRAFHLSASIGIARFPDDADDVESLLRFADIAMYSAKGGGKNRLCAYEVDMGAQRLARVAIEDALRGAIERGEFELEFQPQIDMSTRELVGAEALLRWRNDSLRNPGPHVFVPVAEDIGLVPRLGAWVVETACRQLRAWSDSGLSPPRLAVNLSSLELTPQLADRWRHILAQTRVSPSLLEAELTESCVMRDQAGSSRALGALEAMGVSISLDDFGTGHSSLSLLTKLPLSTVKIDQTFVQNVHHADGAQVVSTIVTLAHRLGMRCVAEGVESAEQRAFLEGIGCDAFQGFLVSRPLSAEAFARRFLTHGTEAHAVH